MPYADREEQKKAQARAYQQKREYYRKKLRERRKKNVEWFVKLRSTLSCIRCGESHQATLDFHHRDPSAKEREVEKMVRNGWSRERVLEEMAKCDVLCSNCHRKLHWELEH